MALNDAALVVGSNAIDTAIAFMQLHSGARGAAGTTNVTTAARVAVNGTVDADGDITWTNVSFSGGAANGTVAEVSYWSASTAGTYYGGSTITGDTSFNAAGEFVLTSVTETSTAS